MSSNHQEADTMLILHALDAAKSNVTVHILSPDTNVFIPALRSLPELGKDTRIITGKGENTRIIPLQ